MLRIVSTGHSVPGAVTLGQPGRAGHPPDQATRQVRVSRLRTQTVAGPRPSRLKPAARAGRTSTLGDEAPGDPAYLAIRVQLADRDVGGPIAPLSGNVDSEVADGTGTGGQVDLAEYMTAVRIEA